MTLNNVEIYINFIAKHKYRLTMTMESIFEEIGRPYYPGKKYEVLNISGEDSEG